MPGRAEKCVWVCECVGVGRREATGVSECVGVALGVSLDTRHSPPVPGPEREFGTMTACGRRIASVFKAAWVTGL